MQMCWKEVQGAESGVRCLWNSKEEKASLSTGERSRRWVRGHTRGFGPGTDKCGLCLE